MGAGLLLQSAWAGVDVRIEGLEGALRNNVELRLGIVVQRDRDDLDQALVEALHHQAGEAGEEARYPGERTLDSAEYQALQRGNFD